MKDSLVQTTCIALFIFLTGTVQAQQDFAKDLSDSILVDGRDSMDGLIKLVVVDGRLCMLKNWRKDDARARTGEDQEDRLDDETLKLIERGIPEKHARKLAERRVQMGIMPPSAKRLEKVFSEIAGRTAGSSSNSSGEDNWERRFRAGGLDARARRIGEQMRFEFNTQGGIELSFLDDEDDFKIRLFTDSGVFYIHQNVERTQFVLIRGEDAKVFVADDYYQLREKHSEIIESELLPVLKEIGISEPMTLDGEDSLEVALDILEAHQDDWMKVQGLLDGLQSDSISGREAAYQKLLNGYYKWYGLIDELKSELKLDESAEAKLNKVLTAAPGTTVQDYVMELDLLNDKKELLRLLKVVPENESAPVISQLKELTGESHGYDIEAWTKVIAEPAK